MNIICNECRVDSLRTYYSCPDCEDYDCCDLCFKNRSQLSHDVSHKFIRIVPYILDGEKLGHDHSIRSIDGYTVEFHSDGNLCIYKKYNGKKSNYLWESGTKGISSDTLYNNHGTLQLLSNGEVVWEKTKDTDGILVELEHDTLVYYNGIIVWRSEKMAYIPNLTPPKRLFHTPSMSTIFTKVANDVEKKDIQPFLMCIEML
jgi:hypothetical protein